MATQPDIRSLISRNLSGFIPEIFLCALVLWAGLFWTGDARAAAGPWQGNEVMKARIVTATDAAGSSGSIDAGLEFRLEPGWKVYWRSPGDAGLPPVLDFSASPAVRGHRLDFPAPVRFSILGFDSFGYSDHVILPLTLELENPGKGFAVSALLEGLVCSDICIPVRETLSVSLPSGQATASPEARKMAEFRSRVPGPGTAAGVDLVAAELRDGALDVRLERDGRAVPLHEGDILIETVSGFSFAKPEFAQGFSRLEISGRPAAELLGEAITVTVISPSFLLEAATTVTEAKGGASTFGTGFGDGLFAMLMVAFLGGVILNVMPCVLPVLSLKLASVLGHGGEEKRKIRWSFLATAAGVVTSFVLLGLSVYALRSAGIAIGWGIQFQQPVFLIFAALAIGFFGLIMLDITILPVPGFIQNWGRALPSGLAGDFFSGALATLLATPCSAPFLGTAVAFALTAPGDVLLLIFAVMGAGLASPWIAVAARPSLVGFLPRPGRWLIGLKRVLAAGLFATSFWLVTVLATHLSASTSPDGLWQTWSPGLAEEKVALGQVVFVDVTADWCITCQTNKVFVLNTEQVMEEFRARDVELLRADWTKPDDEISRYLALNGRYGIPFNMVYGPLAPQGIPLGEILTTSMVLDAIRRAGGD